MDQKKLTPSSKRSPKTFSELVDYEMPLFSVGMRFEKAAGQAGTVFGASFETTITISNRGYENKNLGVVKKNQVPKQYVGGKFFHAGKSTVDYDGYLMDVGFVAFDCKSTNEKVWRPERSQLHQFLYLYRGQSLMGADKARFFYLVERRWCDDSAGSLQRKAAVYLVENLENVKQTGKYEFNDDDLVLPGPGILLDYRAKLMRVTP